MSDLTFNCDGGCGECSAALTTYETYRHEVDGVLVERRTEPRVVSSCCGASISVWDAQKEDVVASVNLVGTDGILLG